MTQDTQPDTILSPGFAAAMALSMGVALAALWLAPSLAQGASALGVHPLLLGAKFAGLAAVSGLVWANNRFGRRLGAARLEIEKLLLAVMAGLVLCFAGVVALGKAALDGQGWAPSVPTPALTPALVCLGVGMLAALFLALRAAPAPRLALKRIRRR